MNRPSTRRSERIYGLVVALYPRNFREQYGPAMRLVFQDLLQDPEMPAWRIWLSVLSDLRGSFLHEHLASLAGGLSMSRYRLPSSAVLRRGAVFGCAIVVIWIMFRALHVGVWLGSPSLLVPWLLFAPAGFVGARTTGTFGGGIWAGLAAGLIALLTIPGDYLLFHHLIPGGVVPTTLTLTAAAAVAMMFAAIGTGLAMLRPRSGASRWVFRLGGLTVAWHTEVKGHDEPLGQVPL